MDRPQTTGKEALAVSTSGAEGLRNVGVENLRLWTDRTTQELKDGLAAAEG